jgi:hypothetical protein
MKAPRGHPTANEQRVDGRKLIGNVKKKKKTTG